jgi:hypothetical protein
VTYISVSLRDWALEWVKGSIVSYFSDKTSLNAVMGIIRRAIKSYGIKPGEIRDIISLKTLDPGLNILSKVKEEKTKPLLEFIEELKKDEKSD